MAMRLSGQNKQVRRSLDVAASWLCSSSYFMNKRAYPLLLMSFADDFFNRLNYCTNSTEIPLGRCAYDCCIVARKRQRAVGAIIHYAQPMPHDDRGHNELWPLHWLDVTLDTMQKSHALYPLSTSYVILQRQI